MEFLKEIPTYWLALIGFGVYCFIGFLIVLMGILTGYLTDEQRLEDWRSNINPSINPSDEEAKQRLCINVMFWLWPWFVGVVFPFCFLIRVLAKIIFVPGKLFGWLINWECKRRERRDKATKEEEKSIPRCAYCHKSSGTLERFADPPIYFHRECVPGISVFRDGNRDFVA